ncbi:MAG: D-arabinono-1,4-lactone oxidase [Pseudomonadales bacterium]
MSTSLSRRSLLANTALAALFAQAGCATSTRPSSVPWRNWSGALICQPSGRLAPSSEEQLAQFLSSTSGKVRPVGSGHSFAPLVPTDGHLVVLDRLSGLIDANHDEITATFGAGTRLSDLGPALETANQALFNLPDIDRQTLAGAISTATHGTGRSLGCLSAYVTGLRMVSAGGQVIDLSAREQPDLFSAARVSLGALGIFTRVQLQNRRPYRLKAINAVAPIQQTLANFDSAADKHRHFEMFPLVHSDYALTLSIDETDEPVYNPPADPAEEAAFAAAMASWAAMPPKDRPPHINGLAEQIEPSVRVDASYRILSNVRNNRFNEMEYSVPANAGADCLSEILHTIRSQAVDVVFPLEYRYVRGDDTWLGMSSGDEDHAAISIHRVAGEDFRPYFDLIEPIFWKYGGRPHWGKVHSLGASQLTKLYPRFQEFLALRRKLDPKGRLLNGHLQQLFGT